MKQINPKALDYIARTYGKKFAGDESDPSQSEVSDQDAVTDQLLSQEEAKLANTPQPTPGGAEEMARANNPNFNTSFPEAQPVMPQTPSVAPAAPAPNDVAQPSPYSAAGVPDIEGGLREQQAAQTAGAEAQSQQGQAEVKAYQNAQAALSKLPTANDIAASYKAKDDALFQAYQQNKLDPNRVWNNTSTAGKIGAGLAMILGGIGSGATGQPNMAADMIEKSINRDIDAQKNSQDQQMNLWRMNKEEYGNDLAANLTTQNQLLLGTKAQLEQAASAAKGPIAQANAQNANALIDQKIAENRFRLSLMQPTSDSNPNSPAGIDPAKKIPWLVPADRQGKAFDENEAAQNTTRNASQILNAFDKAAVEARPVTALSQGELPAASSMIPGIDSANQMALHALLGPTFKDVEGTVRQAAMDNMFKNTTPQFGDSDEKIETKRNALIGYMLSKSSAPTNSAFGINLGDYPSTNVKGAIPKSPQQEKARPQIKYDSQGNAWKLGPNGKPVKVNAPKNNIAQSGASGEW